MTDYNMRDQLHLHAGQTASCSRSARGTLSISSSSACAGCFDTSLLSVALYQWAIAFSSWNCASGGGDNRMMRSRSLSARLVSLLLKSVFTLFITLKPLSASTDVAGYLCKVVGKICSCFVGPLANSQAFALVPATLPLVIREGSVVLG